MSGKVFSGARARFKINGKKIAYAGGVDGTEEVVYEPVDVLDKLEVAEYVPVGYRVTLSCSIFRTVGESLKKLNIFPKEDNILTSGDLVATVEDSQTGRTIAQYEGVKASSKNFSITARGIVGQNVTFVAIRAKDEADLE